MDQTDKTTTRDHLYIQMAFKMKAYIMVETNLRAGKLLTLIVDSYNIKNQQN